MAQHFKSADVVSLQESMISGPDAPAKLLSCDVYGPGPQLKKVRPVLNFAKFHEVGETINSAASQTAWLAIAKASQKDPFVWLSAIENLFTVFDTKGCFAFITLF